ncbi:zinc ribbon domain-containing protein [Paeniglutamicibacter sp. Y32M11]|uniref:zinc ribbon domain-containing protein n=1 Tax=Paeniglutamicibacter sp. Y32M11 TaxID=2853258 RepID=UPI001C52E45E|nr:DNA-binding protein [Paeniglutamicibacter sp. Y32M11]QXQ08845.1 DNA-binding protein [Paeniglutamicibacter sp. Y32M11]
MAKAAPAEQLRLLDVAALDSEITKLTHQIDVAKADAELAAAHTALTEARAAEAEVKQELDAAAAALKASELAVEKVASHIAKDQARINSNSGTATDLMALSHEIDSLTVRRNELEDNELELMGTLEEVQEQAAVVAAETAAKLSDHDQHLARRDAAVKALQDQLAKTTAARAELVGTFEESLINTYERLRTRNGVGAARLFHGTSEASGMALAPGDLSEIKAAAADDIVFCPDTGAILVRSTEW